MQTFRVFAGSDWSLDFTLRDSAGETITTFTSAATLAASAWVGDDQPTAFPLSAAWVDPATGTVRLSLAGSDTAGVPSALYRVRLAITASGRTITQPIFLLDIQAAPSETSDPLKVYCSFDDVRRFAPWIGELITADPSLQSDLAEQRAEARGTLDDAILAAYRPYGRMGTEGLSAAGFGLYPSGDGYDTPSKWLREQLDADRLMVDGSRGRIVREITARLAIALACEPQIGEATEGTSYQSLARRMGRRAIRLMDTFVAEIDLNDDGWPDLTVRLGVVSGR